MHVGTGSTAGQHSRDAAKPGSKALTSNSSPLLDVPLMAAIFCAATYVPYMGGAACGALMERLPCLRNQDCFRECVVISS